MNTKQYPGRDVPVTKNEKAICRYCKANIAFLISAKGKKYCVNLDPSTYDSFSDQWVATSNDFHNCEEGGA